MSCNTPAQEKALAEYYRYGKFDELVYDSKGGVTAIKHIGEYNQHDISVTMDTKGKLLKEQHEDATIWHLGWKYFLITCTYGRFKASSSIEILIFNRAAITPFMRGLGHPSIDFRLIPDNPTLWINGLRSRWFTIGIVALWVGLQLGILTVKDEHLKWGKA